MFCIVPQAYSYVKTSKSGLSHILVLHREGWGLGGLVILQWSPLSPSGLP